MRPRPPEAPVVLPSPAEPGYRKEDKPYWCNCSTKCHGIRNRAQALAAADLAIFSIGADLIPVPGLLEDEEEGKWQSVEEDEEDESEDGQGEGQGMDWQQEEPQPGDHQQDYDYHPYWQGLSDDFEPHSNVIASLMDLKIALAYVRFIKEARLEDSGSWISQTTPTLSSVSACPVRSSGWTLGAKCGGRGGHGPGGSTSSYDQVCKRIQELSGVIQIKHDMCIKSCMAYTGPLSQLDSCLKCQEARYRTLNGKKLPRQQFCTIPIGPQLQALARSPETARLFEYRVRRTKEVIENHTTRLPMARCT
ncbi:hypothetical protein FA13DRAFT_1789781 [Coprinellus micaceus]|uniref:Uncharacterized protein n=1 Tax=Coprinellus micaceus TaxID=71717 RepID=A0A4Y7TIJ6_COPMI|nr:hypothetical protein FA13DRAFT_1789781 [Coprinellus micaceus]